MCLNQKSMNMDAARVPFTAYECMYSMPAALQSQTVSVICTATFSPLRKDNKSSSGNIEMFFLLILSVSYRAKNMRDETVGPNPWSNRSFPEMGTPVSCSAVTAQCVGTLKRPAIQLLKHMASERTSRAPQLESLTFLHVGQTIKPGKLLLNK